MRKGRFTEEQMVAIIREADRKPVSAVSKRHGVSEQTIYTWRKRFGSFEVNDVRRLRQLEARNARLKKLVAERDLESAVFGGAIGVGLSKPEGDAGCAGDRANEGAGGAISALWLSAHWHLSWTGRIRDEPRGSASAAQAAEEARGCEPPAATGADGAEPGVVLRLRVRPLRQRLAAQVPDRYRRVHQGGVGDRT